MSRLTKVVLVICALAVLVAATGCDAIVGSAVKSGVEKATGVKVNESDGSVTVQGKGGATVTTGEKIPDGFPSDVPVYAGTVGSAIESKNDKGSSYMISIDTPDSGTDVVAWYEQQLNEKGWTVKTPVKADDGGLINAENDKWKLTVAVGGGAEGKSNLALNVFPK